MRNLIVFSFVVLLAGAGVANATPFLDDFETDTSANYTYEDSYGSGGSFTISGGTLNITCGSNNTATVMTTDAVNFAVGERLAVDVPPVVGAIAGVTLTISTFAGQPGGSEYGFRLKRYPGAGGVWGDARGAAPNTPTLTDPDPTKPAILWIERQSATLFGFSIEIDGVVYLVGTIDHSALEFITDLHIGAQGYDSPGSTFAFDNLRIVTNLVVIDTDDGVVVAENGVTDEYTVVLATQPTDNVTITPADNADPSQVELDPNALIFTASNWDTPRTITVTAIDDVDLETNPHFTTIHHTVSGDPVFAGAYVGDVSVEISDNDGCGAWGYHHMDSNHDCHVNLDDFADFVAAWMACSMPHEPGCTDLNSEPFSLVIFPDTQFWSQDHPEWFTASTNWVVDNKIKENIKFVIQVGDIVNVYEQSYQWVNANTAMSILDCEVPYCFAVGNHDMLKGDPEWVPDASRDTTFYNATFPYTRYEYEPWYGGRMLNDVFVPSDNYDNTYHFFTVGGLEFMILSLSIAPTDDILAWADGIVAAHPNKRVIFVTHSYMSGNVRLAEDRYSPPGGNAGEHIWQKFVKKHPNIFLVPCGHLDNGRLTSTGDNGNPVHQFVNNNDWVRILRFVPEENMIHVTSYKPWLDQYNTDSDNQYDLPYDMNQ